MTDQNDTHKRLSERRGEPDTGFVTERQEAAPTESLGVGGTAVYGGFIVQKEKDSKLLGIERYRTYGEIVANTSIVAAGVRYFLNLLSKASWTVSPSDDDNPQAVEIAETIDSIINDMVTPWHRVVRRAGMYKFHGFSIQEWTAVLRDDGVIGFLDIEARPQVTIEKWDVDEGGNVFGVVQRSPQDSTEIYLPRNKLLYAVDDTLDDSPEGLGLFRHLVRPARALERFEQLEGFGYETDLRGIPVGRGPFEELRTLEQNKVITRKERLEIEAPLRKFIQNHVKTPSLGILLDSIPYDSKDEARTPSSQRKWDMDLLQGSSTAFEAMGIAIRRKNEEMARILGVEHLLLGAGGSGSLALSRDKSQTFALNVDSALNDLSEVFECDLVDPLMALNGWPEELKPRLTVESAQIRDVDMITESLANLANAGGVLAPNDPAINAVRELMGLPPQDPELAIDLAADSAITQDPISDRIK